MKKPHWNSYDFENKKTRNKPVVGQSAGIPPTDLLSDPDMHFVYL